MQAHKGMSIGEWCSLVERGEFDALEEVYEIAAVKHAGELARVQELFEKRGDEYVVFDTYLGLLEGELVASSLRKWDIFSRVTRGLVHAVEQHGDSEQAIRALETALRLAPEDDEVVSAAFDRAGDELAFAKGDSFGKSARLVAAASVNATTGRHFPRLYGAIANMAQRRLLWDEDHVKTGSAMARLGCGLLRRRLSVEPPPRAVLDELSRVADGFDRLKAKVRADDAAAIRELVDGFGASHAARGASKDSEGVGTSHGDIVRPQVPTDASILVVGQNAEQLAAKLRAMGFAVNSSTSYESERADVVVAEAGADGLALAAKRSIHELPLPMILVTGRTHGTSPDLDIRAYAMIHETEIDERMPRVLERAASFAAALRKGELEGFVATSPESYKTLQRMELVASMKIRILFSGNGDRLACARAVHALRHGKDKPFLAPDCASLTPESLIDALLAAKGGTLYLDPVDAVPVCPVDVQGTLVGILMNDSVANTPLRTDVWGGSEGGMAALEANYMKMRTDLLYRIALMTIPV